MPDSPPLTLEDVRHVARLARLRPSEADIDSYRASLASILDYVALLEKLDVDGVEPLTNPTPGPMSGNRLDHDEPRPPLALDALRRNAPLMEGPFVAVPKVIADAYSSEGG